MVDLSIRAVGLIDGNLQDGPGPVDGAKAALEASQALSRRQGEMIEEGLSGVTAALDALSKSGNVTDAQTRQAEYVKGACAKAMSNTHELIELAAQSSREAAEPLNKRFLEGLDEVKTWSEQTRR